MRVDSGLMPIDEFLDTYTRIEVDKLHRMDALNKFQQQLQEILIIDDGTTHFDNYLSKSKQKVSSTNTNREQNTNYDQLNSLSD